MINDHGKIFEGRAARAEVIDAGRQLFDLLIRGSVKEAWTGLLGQEDRPVRVLLSFGQQAVGDERHSISRLPWELMRDAGAAMVFTDEMPWSRLNAGAPLRPERGPLRVLIVVGSPGALDLLADEELAGIAKALAGRLGRVHTEVIDSPDISWLREAIDTLRPHILHFIGEGTDDHGLVIRSRSEDRGRPLLPDDIHPLLTRWKPWLVILNACRSASPVGRGVAGIGDEFIRAGACSVVSMQSTISPENACILSAELYALLGRGHSVDHALASARRELTYREISWAVPRFVTAVHPQNIIRWEFPIDDESVDKLCNTYKLRDLKNFVGRHRERREAWWALDRTLDHKSNDPPVGLLLIKGEQEKPNARAGKTWFTLWSLLTYHLRGHRVTYVNLRDNYEGPGGKWVSAPRDGLSLVRAIREAIIDKSHPNPIPPDAFSKFNACLNALVTGSDHISTDHGYVEDEGRNWDPEAGPVDNLRKKILSEFFKALSETSSRAMPHVIALDHTEKIMESSDYSDVYRYLLLPAARRCAKDLHLIFVLPKDKNLDPDDLVERYRMDQGQFASVNLPYIPEDQFMRLAREYCARSTDREFNGDLREIFVSQVRPGARFPINYFKEVVKTAELREGFPLLERRP